MDPERRKAEEWSDDPEEEAPAGFERTYRDGSLMHECWAAGRAAEPSEQETEDWQPERED